MALIVSMDWGPSIQVKRYQETLRSKVAKMSMVPSISFNEAAAFTLCYGYTLTHTPFVGSPILGFLACQLSCGSALRASSFTNSNHSLLGAQNSKSLDYQGFLRLFMVIRTGFEPATPTLSRWCSDK